MRAIVTRVVVLVMWIGGWAGVARAADLVVASASASSEAFAAVGVVHAIDGDAATFWSSALHIEPAHTEWIVVEIAETGMLAGVRLTPRTIDGESYAYPRDYAVEYSYDASGTHWFPIAGGVYQDRPTPDGVVTHWFDGQVPARRLRITATDLRADDFGSYAFQLAEVEPLGGDETLPFRIDGAEAVGDQLNAMWSIYGSMHDGTEAVFALGSEPAYHEWMALKYGWSDTTTALAAMLRNERILTWPMSEDGYVWSWSTQEQWPGVPPAYHNENNAKYILGAWRAWTWQRDDVWFDTVDLTTISAPTLPPRPGMGDISAGMTLREKLRLAMSYLENSLQGGGGGITIEDNGMNNDGTVDGEPTNYWDNWKLGYKNAYDNIYYYAALEAMAQLEELWGDDGRAAQLRGYRAGCRAAYNDAFWDAGKGRYICTIDKSGTVWDFGSTFINLEALTYGLGDDAKAQAVFQWLDGGRIIAGETSTGADIYAWGFAPRSNTIAIETIGPPYWWADFGGAIDVETSARWPTHLENGGAIFYVSYYDLMARLRHLGPDDALSRLMAIVDEFSVDQLRRDPTAPGSGPWQLGIVGEFPESGLVPAALVYGFAGIRADAAGLHIAPELPTAWSALTIRGVTWAGTRLTITASHSAVTVSNDATATRTPYVCRLPLSPGMTVVFPHDDENPLTLQLVPAAVADVSYVLADKPDTATWPGAAVSQPSRAPETGGVMRTKCGGETRETLGEVIPVAHSMQRQPACADPPVDSDGDGDVDMADVAVLQWAFGSEGPFVAGADVRYCLDLDCDEDVDITDVRGFGVYFFGAEISPPTP